MPSDVLDYPVPHSDWHTYKDVRGAEHALMVKAGVNVTDSVSVLLGVGYSWRDTTSVAQSNVTGWLYNQGTERESHTPVYVGAMMRVQDAHGFSAGYDTRRGVALAYVFLFGR
jgi:hypothetical protein